MANAARQAADVAKSMLVTAWNLAIAGGGLIGGVLLGGALPRSPQYCWFYWSRHCWLYGRRANMAFQQQ